MAYKRTGGRRLYVGRVPSDANRDDLEKLFYRIGDVVDVRVLQGFAFVEFERLRDAQKAVDELDGYELLGHRITVEYAKPPRSAADRRESLGYDPRRSGGDRSYGRGDGYGYHYEYYTPPARGGGGGGRSGNPRGYRVQVVGLPRGTSWQDLKDWGRTAGTVTFADIVDSGEGFLEYGSPLVAEDAVRELDGSRFNGETIRVYSEREEVSTSSRSDRDSRDRDSGYSSYSSSRNYERDRYGSSSTNRDDERDDRRDRRDSDSSRTHDREPYGSSNDHYTASNGGSNAGRGDRLDYEGPSGVKSESDSEKLPAVPSKAERGRSRSPVRPSAEHGDDGWS